MPWTERPMHSMHLCASPGSARRSCSCCGAPGAGAAEPDLAKCTNEESSGPRLEHPSRASSGPWARKGPGAAEADLSARVTSEANAVPTTEHSSRTSSGPWAAKSVALAGTRLAVACGMGTWKGAGTTLAVGCGTLPESPCTDSEHGGRLCDGSYTTTRACNTDQCPGNNLI